MLAPSYSVTPSLSVRTVAAVLAAVTILLTVGHTPQAQVAPSVWLADDVAEVALGQPNCIRYPRVNGFGFGLDGTPMVGWTQVEGCGGSNLTYWSEKLTDGWLARQWGDQGFWSGANGFAHEFAVGTDGRPYLFMVGGNGTSLTYGTYRADLRAHADGQPYLFATGEHVGSHQQCVYVTYRPVAGPGQDWPYRTTFRGQCLGDGPLRFEGATLIDNVIIRGHDLAMGPDGRAHVAYTDGVRAFYIRPGIGPVLVAENLNRFNDDVAIQAGADGTLHLVVRGFNSAGDSDRGLVGYLRSVDDGATWQLVDWVDQSRQTYGLSLRLDATGAPALAYWRYGVGLMYTTRATGVWVDSRVAAPGFSGTEWVKPPHLRFNAAGVPHIAYFDWTANRIRISSPWVGAPDAAPPVDLSVSGYPSPNPTVAGTPVSITIDVSNRAVREASGVRIRVTLPPGASAGSVNPAPVSNAGGVLTFDQWRVRGGGVGRDRLPAGATGTLTFTLTGLPTGVAEFPVVVSSTEADAMPEDNSIALTARVNEAACAVPVSGRTAWWPGDGTALNYGGGAPYHGTVVGGVGYGPGAVGQAFVFDGVTGHVQVPNGYDEYYWPLSGSLSVAAWARTTKSDSSVQVIASMDDMANAPCCGSPQGVSGWYLLVKDGVFGATMRNNQYGAPAVNLVGQTMVADGLFHHAALVIDTAALQARLYVDGQLEASAALTPGWTMNNGDFEAEQFVIGAAQVIWGSGYRYFFDGAVDDVALYKRVLSPAEIANAATGPSREACGAPPPLVLNSPGDQSSTEGEAVSVPLTWTAGDGKTLAFMATGLPAGLSIGQYTGIISGAAADGSAGVYPVTVTMSDGTTDVAVSFVWTVIAPTRHTLSLTAGPGVVLTVSPGGAECVGLVEGQLVERTCQLLLPEAQYAIQATSVTGVRPASSWWQWAGESGSSSSDRVHVVLDADRHVTSALLVEFAVTLQHDGGPGDGALGTVTATLPPYVAGEIGFSCDESHCLGIAPLGSAVALTAAATTAVPVTVAWGGACSGDATGCGVELDASTYLSGGSVTASVRFSPVRVPVNVTARAGVLISADRSSDTCLGFDAATLQPASQVCTLQLPVGTNRLTASAGAPLPGVDFRWTVSGVVVANTAAFDLPVDATTPVTGIAAEMLATFGVEVQSGLAPASVTASGAEQFLCAGVTCQGRAPFLSSVALTAVPVVGQSVFERWEGACVSSTPVCSMGVNPLATPDGQVAVAVFRAFVPLSVVDPGAMAATEGDVINVALRPEVDPSRTDHLNVVVLGLPPGLTFNAATSTIEGTLSDASAGDYSIQIVVSDGLSVVNRTIPLTVAVGPRPPVAVDDVVTVTSMVEAARVHVLGNDTDPNDDVLTVVGVTTPQFGTAIIDGDDIVYRPTAAFVGTDTFSYTVRDVSGLTATAVVRVETPADRMADVRAAVGAPVASATTGYPEIPVSVQNAGPATATQVRATLIGAAARLATVVPLRAGDVCAVAGADWVCTLLSLNSGASASLRARPGDAGVAQPWTLIVEAAAAEVDPAPANNRMQIPLSIPRATVDLAVSMDGPQGSVLVDSDLSWTTTVRNLGPEASTQVPVSLQLGGAPVGGVPPGCSAVPTGYTCTVPPLAAGAQWTATVTRRATTPGALTGTVAIAFDADASRFMTDPVAANNSASQSVTVVASTVVQLRVSEVVGVRAAPGLSGGLEVVRLEVRETIGVSDQMSFSGGEAIVRIEVNEFVGVTDGVNGQSPSQTAETPVGSDVTVAVFPIFTAEPIELTFQSVSSPGTSTAEPTTTAPAPPAGFVLGEPAAVYEISTTATFAGMVEVCVPYDRAAFRASTGQRLMHHDRGQWIDITTVNDVAESRVCGLTGSFSPFAVMETDIESSTTGRISGAGGSRDDRSWHRFVIDISEGWRWRGRDRFRYELEGKRDRSSFVATSFDAVAFINDPAFTPGRTGRTPVDAVVARGRGTWNGRAGYQFEIRFEDHGEPGRGRDWWSLTVRDERGRVVVQVDATVDAGNIQAQGRVKR